MKKNKIALIATATVLTLGAGSLALLGNNVTATHLTAGQQTYARVATFNNKKRTMTIDAEAESYRNVSASLIPGNMMEADFEIDKNQNVTSLVNVNKISIDASDDNSAVYSIVSIDDVSIEAEPITLTRAGGVFTADVNIASFSKLRFRLTSYVISPYDFPYNVSTITFNYDCVQ